MGCGSSAPVGGQTPEEGLQLILPPAKATSPSLVKQDSTPVAPKAGGSPEVVVDIVERLCADKKVRGSVILHCAGLAPEQKKNLSVAFTPRTQLSGFKYHPSVVDHQQGEHHIVVASPNGNDLEVLTYETTVQNDMVAMASTTIASDCGNYIKIDTTVSVNLPQTATFGGLEIEVPLPAGSTVAAWNTNMGRVETGGPKAVWAFRRSKPGTYKLTLELKMGSPNAKEEIKKLQPVALCKISIAETSATGVKLKSCTVPGAAQAKKSARYLTCAEPRSIMVQNGKDGVPVPSSASAPAPAPAPAPVAAPAPAAPAPGPESAKGIAVQVRTVRREIVELTIPAEASVKTLKEAMRERTGIDVENQRCIAQGRVIDDGQMMGLLVPASGPVRITWQDRQSGDNWGVPSPSTLQSPRDSTRAEMLTVKVLGSGKQEVPWDSQETVKSLKARLAPLVNLPAGQMDVLDAANTRLQDDAVLGGFPSLLHDPSRTIIVMKELTR
mmetsp:Transcript_19671/g.45870  ORF Transcript_19671/g.45870 Transcript_19671/m.45870 type:complete len:497 (+) Transcript_19671:99-1589(+)